MNVKSEISGNVVLNYFKAYELRIEVVQGKPAEVRYHNGKRMAVQRVLSKEEVEAFNR